MTSSSSRICGVVAWSQQNGCGGILGVGLRPTGAAERATVEIMSDRRLLAPGASHHAPEVPCAERPPRIDERLAPPETRLEYLRGSEIFAAPADPPHATQHSDLTYVLHAHVRSGYRSAVDMLTRTGAGTDIAPDASVFWSAPDPVTGGRRLEELAFEVTSEQALSVPTERARDLVRRGVRRVFCILVKQRRFLEWSRETDGWATVPDTGEIEDPCLLRPLPVAALLDAAGGDDAVARALLDKHVPALEEALAKRALDAKREGKAEGKIEGKVEGKIEGKVEGKVKGLLAGKAASILTVLERRGLVVTDPLRRRILDCRDGKTLDRWLGNAVIGATAESSIDGS